MSEAFTAEQQRMLDFANQWLEFGGGHGEDIFVEFGIGERLFFSRLEFAIANQAAPVSDTYRTRLIALCRRRSRNATTDL